MNLAFENILTFVPDLVVAQEFYCSVLGLRLVESRKESLLLQGANFKLALFSCNTETDPGGHSLQAGSAIAFRVQSLEDAISYLTRKGVRMLHSVPNHGPWGRYVAFVDPFGTVHELIETRGMGASIK